VHLIVIYLLYYTSALPLKGLARPVITVRVPQTKDRNRDAHRRHVGIISKSSNPKSKSRQIVSNKSQDSKHDITPNMIRRRDIASTDDQPSFGVLEKEKIRVRLGWKERDVASNSF
jgi:hypothetical protein